MTKKQILFLLGIIIFLVPFSGIGYGAKEKITIVLGFVVAVVAFFLKNDKTRKSEPVDSYEESRPSEYK